MRYRVLITVARWLAVVLILRLLVNILSIYPDYFPPNFNSLFLEGRENTFFGWYSVAFYIHIITGPFVLVNGLILLNESVRRRNPRVHRVLGRVQVAVLLFLMLPSALAMSLHAFAGWWAGLSFVLLSTITAFSAIAGFVYAIRRQFDKHRRWMIRCYVLICSALALRLLSGAADLIGVSNAEGAYILAAWCSWLLPLGVCEVVERCKKSRTDHTEVTKRN